MQRISPSVVIQGVIGGVIAGAVVATWFLATDLAAGHAFETPARLASILLHTPFSGPWPRAVLAYTAMHFGVFAVLGIVAVGILSVMDLEPGLLVGAAFGLGVLNAVHYAGGLLTGENLLAVAPVAQVAAANVLGGMAMMAYLHRSLKVQAPLGLGSLKSLPVLYQGVSTGLVGAAAVAFWFLLVDLAKGGPFTTPAVLGSAILLGASNPADVVVTPGLVAAYTAVHIGAFVVWGLAFAWVMRRPSAAQGFWLRALVTLLVLEALFFGTLMLFGQWVVVRLGWLVILVANLLAVVCMALWLYRLGERARGPATGTVP